MNDKLKDALNDVIDVLDGILNDETVQGVYKVHFDEDYILALRRISGGNA